MPYTPSSTPRVDYERKAQSSETEADFDFAETYAAGLNRGAASTAVMATAGGISDLADTALSSIGLTERQGVNNFFLSSIGSPELTAWFTENRGAAEAVSGIGGVLASNWAANKLLKPAGRTMQAIRGVPYVGSLARLDAAHQRALRVAQLTTREGALRGKMGAELFNHNEMALSVFGVPMRVSSGGAAQAVFGTQIARGAAQNITTEAIMAATLNTNDFLYSDEVAHNLAWGAAGLALGAGIDSAISAYSLRKIANSDPVRRLRAGSLDVTGYESLRLEAGNRVDGLLMEAFGGSTGAYTGSNAVTDSITSRAIQASENKVIRGSNERANALFSKREQSATSHLEIVFEDMGKVTSRGIQGVGDSSFQILGKQATPGLANPLKESLEREPTFLYGISELGKKPADLSIQGAHDLRMSNLAERRKQAESLLEDGRIKAGTRRGKTLYRDLTDEEIKSLQFEVQELRFAEKAEPLTMLNPGEWVPLEFGKFMDELPEVKIKAEGGLGDDNLKVWQTDGKRTKLGIDSDGGLFLPKNRKLNTLTFGQTHELYQLGRQAIMDFRNTGIQFKVPENAEWFVLDMANEIIRQTGDTNSVAFAGKLNAASAQLESFAQKVDKLRASKYSKLTETEQYKLKYQLNLPRTSPQAMVSDKPIIDSVIDALPSGAALRQMNQREVVKLINDLRKIKGFTDETYDSVEDLFGDSFRLFRDYDNNPIEQILAYRRQQNYFEWTQDDLFTRQMLHHSIVQDTLSGQQADPYTKGITDAILSDPNAAIARSPHEIADDQTRSAIPGFQNAAPQTTRAAALRGVVSNARIAVDSPNLLAASRLQELVTKVSAAQMSELVAQHLGDTVSLINSPRNITSKFLLDQFYSYRPGWDLKVKPRKVELGEGKVGYELLLDHTSKKNQARFEQLHGTKLVKDQPLLTPKGTPVVLDELSMDAQTRMQGLYESRRQMKNTLLRSQGLPEIKSTPWYVEPANDKGKYIAYQFDSTGTIIPGKKIVASTPDELSRLEEIARKDIPAGHTIRSRDKVTAYMDLWDKAQMEFMSATTTAIQPNKRNLGTSSSEQLNQNAFAEALISSRDNILRHGQDILEVLYKEPIRAAKIRADMATVETSKVKGSSITHNSNYDKYLENLLGRSALDAKDSFYGEFARKAEARINGLLKEASPGATFEAMKTFFRTSSPQDPVAGETFKQLSKELGQYMPYKSALEMVETRTGDKSVTELADISEKLSWFEAGSRLRWAESAHAMVNVGSIIANMPSVIHALQPRTGETLAEAAARNSSMVMALGEAGEGVVVPHANKLLWSAMKNMRDPNGKFASARKLAFRQGRMNQEVAEFHRQMNTIKDRNGWKGFVFGNESEEITKKGFGGFKQKVAKTGGLDKWMGILTDKSEDLTRQWAMETGFIVADAYGLTKAGDQAVVDFAHEIANKVIADYNPRNRPEIFQGALGAPIGLFQSYVYNFYERMFRYIETKDTKALAVQAATQAGMFGTDSLPGWDTLNWAFFNSKPDGETDPIDSMYSRFGTQLGDLLMHGSMSNLPKVANLLPGEQNVDGVSLFTRGDLEFRMPVNPVGALTDAFGLTEGGNAAQFPLIDTMSRAVKGIQQGVQMLANERGMSGQQIAEILSNMTTNRPLQGLLEIGAAGGYDTSWDGQVVSQARNMGEKFTRILGLRTMRQQKEINNFYNDKTAENDQSVKQARLRNEGRALVRAGREEEVPGLFRKYVENGGSPGYFNRWLQSMFESGIDSRGERRLREALKAKTPDNAAIARMLDAQTRNTEDDLSDADYGREEMMDSLIEQGYE